MQQRIIWERLPGEDPPCLYRSRIRGAKLEGRYVRVELNREKAADDTGANWGERTGRIVVRKGNLGDGN